MRTNAVRRLTLVGAVDVAMVLLLVVGLAPPSPGAVEHHEGDLASRITSVQVAGTQPLGPFATGMWTRLWGTVSGVVGPDEGVVGFDSLPKDASGFYHYTSQFEVIIPDAAGVSSDIVVDIENRGSPAALVVLNEMRLVSGAGSPATITYPPELGTGFMQDHGVSYGRVQWQTGIASDVPATAQGVGLVIVRDFGRIFTESGFAGLRASSGLPSFEHTILFGGSQSAWFANTLLAEGYDTGRQSRGRVFDGVFELNGAGNWLAINRLAEQTGVPQQPYVGPSSVPLTYEQLLLPDATRAPTRLVDVVTLTDYYRLRASVSLQAPIPPNVRRYDVEAAHASATAVAPSVLFGTLGCNHGQPVPLNPIDVRKYEGALLLDLVAELSSPDRGNPSGRMLPRSAIFRQAPAPPGSDLFNALPGHELTVPAVDGDGMPIGGVRLPDQVLPLGRPSPPALPHVGTLGINDGCGNFGGWVPFSASELAARYGSLHNYERSARVALDKLAAHGFVLRDDIPTIVDQLAAHYTAAPQ